MFTCSCVFAAPVEHLLCQHPELDRSAAIHVVRRAAMTFANQHGWLLKEIPSDICFLGIAPTPAAAEAIADHLAMDENGPLIEPTCFTTSSSADHDADPRKSRGAAASA